MDFKKLSEPLDISFIDFRVQSINKGGYATILAYKDARVDMIRLDEVCTPLGWKREHLNNNANCIVSIWCESKKQWVSKEDTGTKSMAEAEKGLASDSFKRACFNWGIGRELYDYPIISIKLSKSIDSSKPKNGEWLLDGGKPKQGFALKIKDWAWSSRFNEEGKLIGLIAIDDNGKERFSFPEAKKKPYIKKEHKPKKESVTLISACEDMKTSKNEIEATAKWKNHIQFKAEQEFIDSLQSVRKTFKK